jgi:uncharacterized repeat protein (TIGR03803 family)
MLSRSAASCCTFGFCRRIAIFLFCVAAVATVEAQTYQIIHEFQGPDGVAGLLLTRDRGGNLYGITAGGPYSGGPIFKLTNHNGNWILNRLHSFPDPSLPHDGAGVSYMTLGPDGNLYGVTSGGGAHNTGTVFKLSPPPTFCRAVLCPWVETTLYDFAARMNGWEPNSLLLDSHGVIYGTTEIGGNDNCGLVYQLLPTQNGWTYSVMHTFSRAYECGPGSSLALDSAGNLYGATRYAVPGNCGEVYQLTPVGSGWMENILYALQGANDGCAGGGVISDSSGNLYGWSGATTQSTGTIFELVRASGSWSFEVLYNFPGFLPVQTSGLTLDTVGNLYGGNSAGVSSGCLGGLGCGSVFKLTRTGDQWAFSDLHDFDEFDGGKVMGPVSLDSAGNVYGITYEGGNDGPNCEGGDYFGCGVVFEISP